MASGISRTLGDLPVEIAAVLYGARRALLTTTAPDGSPRPVPVCFALRGNEIVSAVDHKPKSGASLARINDIRRTGRAVLLVDRWDEDWTRLAWLRIAARARVDEPGSATAALVSRYPQYANAAPVGEVIALAPERIVWWAWMDPGHGDSSHAG